MLDSTADFEAALAADKEEAKGPALIIPSAPYDVAKIFVERHQYEGLPIIRHYQDQFFVWRGNAYREMDENDVRARIYEFLDNSVKPSRKPDEPPEPVKPNPALVSAVLDGLRAVSNIDTATPVPAWLTGADWRPPPHKIIACANGLLYLPTKSLLKGSPDFFSLNALDFDYDETAPEPAEFIEFLNQLWPKDDESINTLQQIFGLLLTSDTSFQKAFMLIGLRRSGKGTIGRILGKLLGKGSICALKLKDLGTDFGRWPLIGKLLAIVSDARLKGKTDKSAIAEELLSITGEDYRTINRKYLAPWIGQLLARFLIISNELPQIEDMSGALASRFIVLILKISFYGQEDRGLTDRLYPEMPGILNWAIEGWERLQEAGKFTQPSVSAAAIQKLEDMGSPIKAFVRDRCEMGANYSVEKNKLYSAWLQWCDEGGYRFTTTGHVFGRDLYSAFPDVDETRPINETTGKREEHYKGLQLKGRP